MFKYILEKIARFFIISGIICYAGIYWVINPVENPIVIYKKNQESIKWLYDELDLLLKEVNLKKEIYKNCKNKCEYCKSNYDKIEMLVKNIIEYRERIQEFRYSMSDGFCGGYNDRRDYGKYHDLKILNKNLPLDPC